MGKLRPPSWGSEGTGPGIGGFRQPCPLLLQLPPTGPLLWQKGTAAASRKITAPSHGACPARSPTLSQHCPWAAGGGAQRSVSGSPSAGVRAEPCSPSPRPPAQEGTWRGRWRGEEARTAASPAGRKASIIRAELSLPLSWEISGPQRPPDPRGGRDEARLEVPRPNPALLGKEPSVQPLDSSAPEARGQGILPGFASLLSGLWHCPLLQGHAPSVPGGVWLC